VVKKVVSLLHQTTTNLTPKIMKTYEMTTQQIFTMIKEGEAHIESIAVCGRLFNNGGDPFYIRIEGDKIIGMKKVSTGYEIDKISLVTETPDSEIMKLASRVKESADEAKRLSEQEMTIFVAFFE
jgi:hypothetical protein